MPGFDGLQHGSLSTYTNHQCRCVDCRGAHADYMRMWRQAKNDLLLRGLVNVEHGRDSTYHNWLCRCQDCRDAHAQHEPEKASRARYRLKMYIYRRASLQYGDIMEPKPDWAPQFLEPQCMVCNTKLVPVEAMTESYIELRDGKPVLKLADIKDEAKWQWVEWMCPHCLDGVRFDWTPEQMEELLAAARKDLSRYLVNDLEFNWRGLYVATTKDRILAAADEPRKALKEAKETADYVVYVPPEGFPIVAPVDVMAAFFKLKERCPSCGNPVLHEEFSALFTITRTCKECGYKDLWRIVQD